MAGLRKKCTTITHYACTAAGNGLSSTVPAPVVIVSDFHPGVYSSVPMGRSVGPSRAATGQFSLGDGTAVRVTAAEGYTCTEIVAEAPLKEEAH